MQHTRNSSMQAQRWEALQASVGGKAPGGPPADTHLMPCRTVHRLAVAASTRGYQCPQLAQHRPACCPTRHQVGVCWRHACLRRHAVSHAHLGARVQGCSFDVWGRVGALDERRERVEHAVLGHERLRQRAALCSHVAQAHHQR